MLFRSLNINNKENLLQEFFAKIIGKEFLGNMIRYTVNLNNHILTIDIIHEMNEKIHEINEVIKFYLDSKKIKTFRF